ncbi:MAG: hypothetical protein NFW16_21020 [Candidatus Accumulibacter sp.]|uniref:hypothetical protein n=1 Tax=Accumulibacter sp. TaxID=2053492 RepID=UPI002583037D|nr:hypothetical protein [Accumulibacter sp.]MCM8624148.1 hypothetical protein [Accumulibacter sp.]
MEATNKKPRRDGHPTTASNDFDTDDCSSTAARQTSREIYRARTIKRNRRTGDQIAQLERQILDVLNEDHPQSVRHVFYRMTDPRLPEPVEKSERGYRHVQDRCVRLRRNGTVPYGYFADLSRRGYFVSTYSDAGDFLHRINGLYRADLWRDADVRCEVWCESRSIASVLLDLCNELAVNLFPCGGFSSLSYAYEAAQQHNLSDDDRPLVVLYVGDYDPAGVVIDVSLEAELRRHLHDDIDLDFRRIGITEYQIQLFELPTKPRKEGDRRSAHVAYSVEAEALPAAMMRSIVRAEIEALLPSGALAVTLAAERSEREHLRRMESLLSRGAA